MPVGWGICPMKFSAATIDQYRYCAMQDFDTQIRADGGGWAAAECLGDHAVVKVSASLATLQAIDATPGFVRIPRKTLFTESLADLTAGEKTTIQNKLNALGYSNAEIAGKLGNDLGAIRLVDLLRFVVSRWRRPAAIIGSTVAFETFDWPGGAPCPVEHVDGAVS